MKYALLALTCSLSLALCAQPTVSFTFDDGATADYGAYAFDDWNEMILRSLDSAGVRAIFFVKTTGKDTPRGKRLLESWDARGHGIANHTASHPNFNRADIGAARFERELRRADAVIADYANYTKLFRFPYLKEGDTAAEVDSIRGILADRGYRNGYVTIDASDWYIDGRLRARLAQDPHADLTAFRDFYLRRLGAGGLPRSHFPAFAKTRRRESHLGPGQRFGSLRGRAPLPRRGRPLRRGEDGRARSVMIAYHPLINVATSPPGTSAGSNHE